MGLVWIHFCLPRILIVIGTIKKEIYREYVGGKWKGMGNCAWERPYGWQRKPTYSYRGNTSYKLLLLDPPEFIYTTVYLMWMLPSSTSSLLAFLACLSEVSSLIQVGIVIFSTTPVKDSIGKSTLACAKASLKLCSTPALLLILPYAY